MSGGTETTAHCAGWNDAIDWLLEWRDDEGRQRSLTRRELEEVLASQTLPDEGLINALDDAQIARALGVSKRVVIRRSPAFVAACDEYNEGWASAIREELALRGAATPSAQRATPAPTGPG